MSGWIVGCLINVINVEEIISIFFATQSIKFNLDIEESCAKHKNHLISWELRENFDFIAARLSPWRLEKSLYFVSCVQVQSHLSDDVFFFKCRTVQRSPTLADFRWKETEKWNWIMQKAEVEVKTTNEWMRNCHPTDFAAVLCDLGKNWIIFRWWRHKFWEW